MTNVTANYSNTFSSDVEVTHTIRILNITAVVNLVSTLIVLAFGLIE